MHGKGLLKNKNFYPKKFFRSLFSKIHLNLFVIIGINNLIKTCVQSAFFC